VVLISELACTYVSTREGGVVLLATVAVACGNETTPGGEEEGTATTLADMPRSILEGPQGPQSADTPQYGGTLTIIHEHAPTNLGAWWEVASFQDKQFARFAIENLVGVNAQMQPVPQLATEWVVDDVAKTITFTLRQGVKFHDGTTFDAEAAKWNLDKQKSGVGAKEMGGVTSIAVVDPYTVRLTFSEIDPLFIQKLSSVPLGKMVSPTYAQANPAEAQLHPVGTGPFEFVSYEPDVSINFKKFADYWQEGLPYLDAVKIELVADATTRLASFKSGEGQYIYGVSVNEATELKTLGNDVETRLMSLWQLAGDSKNAKSLAADLKVRQAISYAIDNKSIADALWKGYSPPTNQLAIEGMSAYNSAIKGYPYDPVEAKALLAEVGITPENPWKTTLAYQGEDKTAFFTVVQEQLAAVGINVTLKPLSAAAMTELQKEGWDGLFAFSFPYSLERPYSLSLTQFLSRDATQGGSIAIPDAYDAVYRTMLPEADMAKREAAYQELNRMAVDDFCLSTPLFLLGGTIAMSPDLHDCGFCVVSSSEFLPETAWLSGAANTGTTAAAATTTSAQ
jgi:peptide/nickel transport system substrate-binding protein